MLEADQKKWLCLFNIGLNVPLLSNAVISLFPCSVPLYRAHMYVHLLISLGLPSALKELLRSHS